MREEILNWGIDNKSCGGPIKVFHHVWLTLVLTCYCAAAVAAKEDAQGPLGAQKPSLKFDFIELASGSP